MFYDFLTVNVKFISLIPLVKYLSNKVKLFEIAVFKHFWPFLVLVVQKVLSVVVRWDTRILQKGWLCNYFKRTFEFKTLFGHIGDWQEIWKTFSKRLQVFILFEYEKPPVSFGCRIRNAKKSMEAGNHRCLWFWTKYDKIKRRFALY